MGMKATSCNTAQTGFFFNKGHVHTGSDSCQGRAETCNTPANNDEIKFFHD